MKTALNTPLCGSHDASRTRIVLPTDRRPRIATASGAADICALDTAEPALRREDDLPELLDAIEGTVERHGRSAHHREKRAQTPARQLTEGDEKDPCRKAPASTGARREGRQEMSGSGETNEKRARRDQRVASQFEALEGKITAYALARVVEGLKGLPGHPKGAGRPALDQIAAAVKAPVHALFHPRIRAHIDVLAALHGIETPDDKAERIALARIAEAYGSRHVPVRGRRRKPHLSAVRLDTGIPVQRLKTEACQGLLLDLSRRNGVVRPKVDYDEELDRLAAYGDDLRKSGLCLPAQPGRAAPSATRVARAIGISPDRFARPHLKTALGRLAAEIGVESHSTIIEDAERFTAFVDARIAIGAPAPLSPRGVGYRAIAAMSGVAAQRIANHPDMQRDLRRWLSTLNQEITS